MREKFEKVKQLIGSFEADADKFYNKANDTAGTRVGRGMQDLKNLGSEIREEVTGRKNNK
ncbi:histone H1 [Pedobacter sp. V48]|uniref:histone H1 n=1 Tax=Pedobacter sp. V48 TaxID=509635 RepID=UPI000A0400B0|nr:histone H1 [Pedobacter sp. V48]